MRNIGRYTPTTFNNTVIYPEPYGGYRGERCSYTVQLGFDTALISSTHERVR